jgi:hypothetical protein
MLTFLLPNLPYPGDDRSISEFNLSAKLQKKLEQRSDANIFIEFLLKQWPSPEPHIEGFATESLKMNVPDALEAVRPEWLRIYQNSHLSRHIAAVQLVLDR